MALTDRPTLAAAAGAACIASSATLVRLADVEPATAATFRCLYALPVLGLLLAARGPTVRQPPRAGPLAGGRRRRVLRRRPGPVAPRHRRGRRRHRDGAGQPAGRRGRVPRLVAAGRAAEPAAGARRCRSSSSASCSSPAWSATAPTATTPASASSSGSARRWPTAAFLLLLRHGSRDLRRAAGPLFDATAVAAVVCVALGPVSGGIDLVPSWPAHGWLVTLALTSQVVGWLLIAVSLPRVPAALTSVILLLQPVASVGAVRGRARRATLAGPAARAASSCSRASSPRPPAAASGTGPCPFRPRRWPSWT